MNADLTTDVFLSPPLQRGPARMCPSPEVRAQQIKSIAHSHATDVNEQAPRDPSPFCHGKRLGDSFPPVCRNTSSFTSQESVILMSVLHHISYTLQRS